MGRRPGPGSRGREAADVERLRELHVACFRAVAEVVSASKGQLDRVVVVNTQLFALG